MSFRRRAWIVVTLLTVAYLGQLGTGAGASCAPPPTMRRALRDAPAAFVGAVVETTNSDRWAVVEVTDVWKGDVDARVEVRGGPADPPGPLNAASSVDRTYRAGRTYLFVPDAGSGGTFQESSCSATTVYRAGLERLRPAGAAAPAASPPQDDGDRGRGGGFPLWLVGALAAAAAGAALVVGAARR